MPDRTETETPMPVVGLTGGIASGKTKVSGFLAEWGAHIIDADSVGHAVIAPDGEAFAEVVAAFGEEILGQDGAIDRRKLGPIVFADPGQLERLNAISHPRMAQRMAAEIARLRARQPGQGQSGQGQSGQGQPGQSQSRLEQTERRPSTIVLDAAILLEAGWDALCDEVWVVVAEPGLALERLMARDGLKRDEAQARLDAQMSNEARMARAGRVIHNNGTLDQLRSQVQQLWRDRTSGQAAAS